VGVQKTSYFQVQEVWEREKRSVKTQPKSRHFQ